MSFAIGLIIVVGVWYLYGTKVKGEVKKNSIRDDIDQSEIEKQINELTEKLEKDDE